MKSNKYKAPWMNQPKGIPYMWMPLMPPFGWGKMPPNVQAQHWMPPVWPAPQWSAPPAWPMPQWFAPQWTEEDGEECMPPWMDSEYMKQFFPFMDPENPIGAWLAELRKWLQEMPIKRDAVSEGTKESCQERDVKKAAWPYFVFPPFPFATEKKRQEYRPFSWLTPEKATAILKIIFDASDEQNDFED